MHCEKLKSVKYCVIMLLCTFYGKERDEKIKYLKIRANLGVTLDIAQ